MIMLAMNMARVNGANPFVNLSRATLNNMTTTCCNSFSPLIPLKHFNLKYYSALRMAPLPPCGAKFKEGMPAPEEEQQVDMVLNVLSKQADAALVLLSKMSLPEEDMAAKADLKDDLSNLATAARKGELLKPEGIRSFISVVFRLIELAYRLYPRSPWAMAAITVKEFVDFAMDAAGKIKAPGFVEALKMLDDSMGKFPESEIDVDYINSILMSMNVAKDLVYDILNNTPKQLEILNMLRASMDGHQLPSTPDED